MVPPNTPLGVQPVVVTVGGVPGKTAFLNISSSAADPAGSVANPFFFPAQKGSGEVLDSVR
jgi:hypothetical protein